MSTERDPTTDSEQPASISIRLSKDDAFHLLQNSRRRAVLRYLLEHDEKETFVMRDIAEAVAAWEHDTSVRQLSSDERQRVYITLYQNHLPKLDDYGVIEYEQSRGIVEPTPVITLLEPFLEDTLHIETSLSITLDEETEPMRDRLSLPFVNTFSS